MGLFASLIGSRSSDHAPPSFELRSIRCSVSVGSVLIRSTGIECGKNLLRAKYSNGWDVPEDHEANLFFDDACPSSMSVRHPAIPKVRARMNCSDLHWHVGRDRDRQKTCAFAVSVSLFQISYYDKTAFWLHVTDTLYLPAPASSRRNEQASCQQREINISSSMHLLLAAECPSHRDHGIPDLEHRSFSMNAACSRLSHGFRNDCARPAHSRVAPIAPVLRGGDERASTALEQFLTSGSEPRDVAESAHRRGSAEKRRSARRYDSRHAVHDDVHGVHDPPASASRVKRTGALALFRSVSAPATVRPVFGRRRVDGASAGE